MPEDKRIKASKARLAYLDNREKLLQQKVDKIALKLFDKINEDFLKKLELSDGKVVNNASNIRATTALNSIYSNFNKNYNIPVIKSFLGDLNGIGELNEKYFNEVVEKPTTISRYKAEKVVNEQLGLTKKGEVIPGGFVDKFANSKEVIDNLKKKTLQGITQGKGFQELRQELKASIIGVDGKPLSGQLHQYYRNNAYDTLTKVDRLYSDTMAKDLKLKYFYWSGGIINTTRKLCKTLNGFIINAMDFKKLKFDNLQIIYRSGVPDGSHSTWHPLSDLGGYGCRHIKDYISTKLAQKYSKNIFNLNKLLLRKLDLEDAA